MGLILKGFISSYYCVIGTAKGTVKGLDKVINNKGSFFEGLDEGMDEITKAENEAIEKYGDNLIGDMITRTIFHNPYDFLDPPDC